MGNVSLVGFESPQDGCSFQLMSSAHATVSTYILMSLGVCSLGDVLGHALSIGESTR